MTSEVHQRLVAQSGDIRKHAPALDTLRRDERFTGLLQHLSGLEADA